MTTPDADHQALSLALSQAEHHAAAAYDALLAVSPLALSPTERTLLDAARASAGALSRSVGARRQARKVSL